MRQISVPSSFAVPFLSLAWCAGPLSACGPRAGEQARLGETAELEPTSQTLFGEELLLFLEHPHVVRGESARFLAHMSVLATGEPVRSGRVTLEIGGERLVAERPKRDGLFVPEGSLPTAGSHPARLVVESEQATESLVLAPVIVHDGHAAARTAAQAVGEEPAGAVTFLMEQQWNVELLLVRVAARTLTERLLVPARTVAPEGAVAAVVPPVAGRLLAPPGGRLPRTGERVDVGQVLALVEPPLGPSELAQLRALQLELDLRALDVVRAANEAQARLRFAEKESERIARLRAQGLGTQKEQDRAEQDLEVARGAESAARATKEALDALLARRASANGDGLRLPVVAPLAGNVAGVRHVPGESVGPEDELFRIVDATHLWIEGRVSEFDLARLAGLPAATATFAALPGRSAILATTPYLAPEIDPTSRTLVIRYELENPDGGLPAGLLAELALATAEVEAALAIPRAAVVQDQGLPTAYVMLEGELFQKRELELGIVDGDWVEVRRGLAAGEHVATRGAHVVKLATLAPASFGAGHQH